MDDAVPVRLRERAAHLAEYVLATLGRQFLDSYPEMEGLRLWAREQPFAPVEVGASVDASGVHPWHVGELPVQCAALNRSSLNVVQLAIDAVAAEDARAIRHAAMLDPNTAATLTAAEIWDLCDALVEAHGDVLPPWARQRVTLR